MTNDIQKLQLNQETLRALTLNRPDNAGQRIVAATFPPVCEMSNFITCHCTK